MKLTMLYKDEGSGKNGCPSVYITDSGDLVVQGAVLDGAESGELENVLPGEGAVRVAASLLIEAVDRYRELAGQGR